MSDQCKHCVVRGDYASCMQTPCFRHESWVDEFRLRTIAEQEAKLAKISEAIENCNAAISEIHEDAENYEDLERSALANMAREIEGILELPF